MTETDNRAIDRAVQLRRMMSEFVRSRTPQERDRTMQIHLAQARGPVMNALLLRQTTGAILRLRAARETSEASDD